MSALNDAVGAGDSGRPADRLDRGQACPGSTAAATVVRALKVLTGCCMLFMGCEPAAAPRAAPAKAVAAPRKFPEGEARVEFGASQAAWVSPEILQFKIPYKFTSGGPRHVYTCSVEFPGTSTRGGKPLHGYELELEGVINTKLVVGDSDVKTFSITMFEAASEMSEYFLISDAVTGEVPARPADQNELKKAGT